jgi:Rieske 2Fe-2S family protein
MIINSLKLFRSKHKKTNNIKRYTRQSFNTKNFDLKNAISNRKEYFSLDREFYLSDEVFHYDIEHIWKKNWLFVGFEFQLVNNGDFFTYQIANESVIVIKNNIGEYNAFHNVCRHRGSRLCNSDHGNAPNIVCPYHQWTYSSDGKLKKANFMGDNFKKEDYSLHKVNLKTVGGLIFINFSNNPPKFDEAKEVIHNQIIHHQLADKAKIAHVINYDVVSNWKLVYENNRECYHCAGGHPEYIKSNYDTSFSYEKRGDLTIRVPDSNLSSHKEIEEWINSCSENWKKFGIECSADNNFPGEGWYRATRTPLRKGFVNETIDGKPVAPLMGKFKERDMGVLRIHTLPNFWLHGSSDYACSTRLTPVSPNLTKAQVIWLVSKDAVEGKDYDLEKILHLWKKTSEQDWILCERNHQGVQSSAYSSGPLSYKKEAALEKYNSWYINNMKKGLENMII